MTTRVVDPFDPSSNTLRPLDEYRDRLPSRRRGRRLNRATLWRWAMKGMHGGRVKLATVRIGGGRFTSDANFHEFMRALEVGPAEPSQTAPGAGPIDGARVAQIKADWESAK